jgi:DNA-binding NarL/FixJ family response regulator
MISIVLVASPPVVRQALRARLSLETDLTIVGEAVDAGQGIGLVQALQPSVVLIDAETPNLDCLALVLAIAGPDHGSGIVVLSLHKRAVEQSLEHTAARVVGKHEGLGALVDAIRAASVGSTRSDQSLDR